MIEDIVLFVCLSLVLLIFIIYFLVKVNWFRWIVLLAVLLLISYWTVQKEVEKWNWYEASVQSQTVGDHHIPRDHADFDSKGNLTGIWIPWNGNKYGKLNLSLSNTNSFRTTVVENWEGFFLKKATQNNSDGSWRSYKLNDEKYIYKIFKLNDIHILS